MRRFLEYVRSVPGPSGFSSKSTAEDVTAGISLEGKCAIVTGAGSGLGEETARVLALRGAKVVLGVRSLGNGEEASKKILALAPNAKVEVMRLDLSSFASIRSFAEEYKAKKLPLNILVNNAGVMACPFSLSTDGYELQLATNHLGHFLLVKELLPLLKESATASKSESRIVNVASMAHSFYKKKGIDFDNLNNQKMYNSWMAYGQSKLANILHARELARRLKDDGVTNVTVNALCPGGIATKLQRHVGAEAVVGFFQFAFKPLFKSIPQGAATSCYVATSPGLKGVSGEYFYDCNVGEVKTPQAKDMELAKSLWEFSEKAVSQS